MIKKKQEKGESFSQRRVIKKEVSISRKPRGSLPGMPMEYIPYLPPALGLTFVREVRKLTYNRDGHLADHGETQLARRFDLIL